MIAKLRNGDVEFGRRCFEILQERRAKPTLSIQSFEQVHVAAHFWSDPGQAPLITGKRIFRKRQSESSFCRCYVGGEQINDRICASHKRLLNQSSCFVVKHPHSNRSIGIDYVDCVHETPFPAGRGRTRLYQLLGMPPDFGLRRWVKLLSPMDFVDLDSARSIATCPNRAATGASGDTYRVGSSAIGSHLFQC